MLNVKKKNKEDKLCECHLTSIISKENIFKHLTSLLNIIIYNTIP